MKLTKTQVEAIADEFFSQRVKAAEAKAEVNRKAAAEEALTLMDANGWGNFVAHIEGMSDAQPLLRNYIAGYIRWRDMSVNLRKFVASVGRDISLKVNIFPEESAGIYRRDVERAIVLATIDAATIGDIIARLEEKFS